MLGNPTIGVTAKKVVTRSLVLVLDGVGSFSSLGGSALLYSLPHSIPQVGSFMKQLFFPVFSSINGLNEIAGLFFVIYLEEFGETRSKTAWVF